MWTLGMYRSKMFNSFGRSVYPTDDYFEVKHWLLAPHSLFIFALATFDWLIDVLHCALDIFLAC